MLKSKLTGDESESGFKLSLMENLKKRFQCIETKTFLSVATLLDPRFKKKYLTDEQFKKSKEEIQTFLKENSVIETSDVEEISKQTDNSKRNRKKSIKGSSIWDRHDAKPHIEVSEPNGNILEKEIKMFITEPLSPRNINIFEYWNSSPFANLKAVAIKYLSAPPTSVASEQLFSAAGRLYSDRRSNLHGVNAEKLLFCHYNIKLFNFKY